MVGKDALIRLSLVISCPPGARGTLKSTRMKTTLFSRSRSRIDSFVDMRLKPSGYHSAFGLLLSFGGSGDLRSNARAGVSFDQRADTRAVLRRDDVVPIFEFH